MGSRFFYKRRGYADIYLMTIGENKKGYSSLMELKYLPKDVSEKKKADAIQEGKEQLDKYVTAKELTGKTLRNYLVVFIGPTKYEVYEKKGKGYVEI